MVVDFRPQRQFIHWDPDVHIVNNTQTNCPLLFSSHVFIIFFYIFAFRLCCVVGVLKALHNSLAIIVIYSQYCHASGPNHAEC